MNLRIFLIIAILLTGLTQISCTQTVPVPNGREHPSVTELHRASKGQDVEKVRALIDAGADVNVRDRNNATPLHYTSRHSRNPEIIKLLIEKGADINAKIKSGAAPLHEAASYMNLEATKVLIEAGADVYIGSEQGGIKGTPLYSAKNKLAGRQRIRAEHGQAGRTDRRDFVRSQEKTLEEIIRLLEEAMAKQGTHPTLK